MATDRSEMFKAASSEHEKFKTAIGDLILAFADLESALYSVLLYYGNISDPVGRAIFSGTRASGMISYLRGIFHNIDFDNDRASDLEEVFSQITAINTMRDMLIHYASGSIHEFDDDDPSRRVLTNSRRVSRYGNAKLYMIGSTEVDNMTADSLTCCWRLIAHTDKQNNPFKPGRNPDGKLHAWLYRSPQPDTKNRSSLLFDQKHRRQRSPSRK